MLLLLLTEVAKAKAKAEADNSRERGTRRRAVYFTRVLVARLSFTTVRQNDSPVELSLRPLPSASVNVLSGT